MEALNCDQKMAKMMLKIRNIRPFYSALYESLEKVESDLVQTMGVSTDKLFYSREFVEKTPEDELLFINLHEIAHVALMHVARRENRDELLWNIACDLYVNQSLIEEFRLRIGSQSEINGCALIKPANGGCFCTSIDVEKDYVENIYDNLDKQAKENGYYSKRDGEYKFEYSGSLTNSYALFNKDDSKNRIFRQTIKIENKEYSVDKDLIDTGDDQSSKEQQARKIITDANVRTQMRSTDAGMGASNIERLAIGLLKPQLDWRKLFKKYLTAITATDSSFSRPDKRMYYQSAIYPGQVAEECNFLDGIKIGIDTSGSISDEDLQGFFYQVKTILNQFKVDAELVYWDGCVKSAGNFTNEREFLRIDCTGGGGTEPEVLFNYLDKQKNQPRVTLVFTDGYFFNNWDAEIKKKRYKDTIWVMTKQHNPKFEPSFGRKAIAKFNS